MAVANAYSEIDLDCLRILQRKGKQGRLNLYEEH